MISLKRGVNFFPPSLGDVANSQSVVKSPALASWLSSSHVSSAPVLITTSVLAFYISSLHPSPTLNAPNGTVFQLSCVDSLQSTVSTPGGGS